MKRILDIICKALVVGGALVTTAYLLMLGWYSLPTLDDYGFIAETTENGILHYVGDYYMHWQSRFSTLFVNGIGFVLFGRCSNLVWVTLIMLLIGYGGVYLILRDALHISKWQINVPVTVLLTNLGILSYLEPSTFYWLCALNYTMATWATIYFVEYIFFSKRPLWLRYTIAIICSIYISGSAENYTPVVIVVLGLIWCYNCNQKRSLAFWKDADMLMQTICLLLICIGCAAMILGPGNSARLEIAGKETDWAASFSLTQFVVTTIKATIVLTGRLISRLPYYLVEIAVCLWAGKQLRNEGVGYESKIGLKNTSLVIFALVGFIVLSVAVCVLGLGWYPALRALCFLSFAILFTIIYLCIRWGNQLSDKYHLIEIHLVLWMMVCIGGMSYLYAIDQPRVKLAHDEITERHAFIQQKVQEGNTEPVVIEPVTPLNTDLNSYSIMRNIIYKMLGKNRTFDQERIIYMAYVLSEDPDDFRNRGIRQYYHANFGIVGWVDAYLINHPEACK